MQYIYIYIYKNVLPISVNRHTYKFVAFFSGIPYVWCPWLTCQLMLSNLREIRNVAQKSLSEHRDQSLLFRNPQRLFVCVNTAKCCSHFPRESFKAFAIFRKAPINKSAVYVPW